MVSTLKKSSGLLLLLLLLLRMLLGALTTQTSPESIRWDSRGSEKGETIKNHSIIIGFGLKGLAIRAAQQHCNNGHLPVVFSLDIMVSHRGGSFYKGLELKNGHGRKSRWTKMITISDSGAIHTHTDTPGLLCVAKGFEHG